MYIPDDTLTSAKELWELASEKTTRALQVQKIRLAIHKKKSELQQAYGLLGEEYYATQQQPNPEKLDELCRQVTQLQEQLQKLQNLLSFAKTMRVCTACGKKNAAGATVCCGCGKKFA